MKLIVDKEAQMVIENLCFSAMKNCQRETFIVNLGVVTKLLNCLEVEKEDPPKENPPTP